MHKATKPILCLAAGLLVCLSANAGRKWTIFLVEHTHTDIGYTKPQSEILSEHLRYIDYAVDYCELTRDYPEGCRFRWTCESAWAVSEYLKVRPESQIRRFKDCIRRSEIEVTGMYFNMAEVADEQSLKYYFHPLTVIRDAGIPVGLAMQNDVNGVAWCMSDYLSDLGIDYFWIGSNKTKSLVPFDVPKIYRWLSPSGKPIVMYRSEHYNTGNFWGIETGDVEKFEKSSAEFLERIEPDYPFNEIGIQYSGVFTDNAPPAWNACEFVKKWNETHDNPKLRLATAGEFLRHISENYPSDMLPELKVAYPDWWTDGFGSAAKETGEARKAQADMMAVTGLLAMNTFKGGKTPEGTIDEIEGIYNNLLFYDEHTFGAAESISDPSCWNSQIQFDNKASYSWAGLRRAKLLYETAGGLLQETIRPSEKPTVTLYNSLAWDRDACATVYVDYEICPKDRMLELVAEDGSKACVQKVRDMSAGRYYRVFARGIPSFGYRTYVIGSSEPGTEGAAISTEVLENEFYRIVIDAERGGIKSIVDLSDSRELVDTGSEWPLGGFIYETIQSRDTLIALRTAGISRCGLSDVSVRPGTDGQVYRSVIITGTAPTLAKELSIEVRLYKNEPKVELAYSMVRKDEFACNALYVAFPFAPSGGRLSMDVQGGIMRPGENQLEGTSSDWNTMQNYVAAVYDGGQTVLSSPEIPMVMLGSLLQEGEPLHYLKTYDRPHVFSWVMNNHWFTNFKASQSGEFNWSYTITSMSDNSDAAALRQGLSSRIDLFPRVIPSKTAVTGKSLPMEWSGLRLTASVSGKIADAGESPVVITGITPASFRKGTVIQIRNLSEETAEAELAGPGSRRLRMIPVNAVEERIGRRTRRLVLAPGADVFVLI